MLALGQELIQTQHPSFANGFARNGSESAFPTLWRGLRGAWCPSVGVQGRKLYDLSGYGKDATFSSGMGDDAWIPSPWGWALKYDGTDDCLSLGTSFFDLNEDWAFMARVRIDDLTHNQYTVIGASVGSSGTSGYFLWLHRQDKGNGFVWQYDTGPGTGNWCTSPNRAASQDTWHTLVISRDQKRNALVLMQDCYATVVDSTNPNFSPSTGQSWGIGTWDPVTPSNCFKGQIGDVLAWNRSLSGRECELLGSGRAHPLMLNEKYNFSIPFVRGGISAGSMMMMGVGD